MRFAIYCNGCVYQAFDDRDEAETWAERWLPGHDWKICTLLEAFNK